MALVSTNSHRCFVVTFLALHVFYIYQTCIFCNPHEIHFGTTKNSLLQKRVSVSKIMMRLIKSCM